VLICNGSDGIRTPAWKRGPEGNLQGTDYSLPNADRIWYERKMLPLVSCCKSAMYLLLLEGAFGYIVAPTCDFLFQMQIVDGRAERFYLGFVLHMHLLLLYGGDFGLHCSTRMFFFSSNADCRCIAER
jgi:hypothetical protein